MGIGIFVFNNLGQVLVGVRKDTNLLALPGGWLERFETWEECAARELLEETAMKVDAESVFTYKVLNCLHKEQNYHNVGVYCVTILPEGQEP